MFRCPTDENGNVFKKEITAVWLVEVIQELKRCHDALKASTGKVDQLKDNVISLQKTKLQNQEQQIKVQNETDNFSLRWKQSLRATEILWRQAVPMFLVRLNGSLML